MMRKAVRKFQSPIGWGLSCDTGDDDCDDECNGVSIPYWLGSKLRCPPAKSAPWGSRGFQSPIGWGLSCDAGPRKWCGDVNLRGRVA